MNKDFEQDIKPALEHKSNDFIQLKNEIWNKIEQETILKNGAKNKKKKMTVIISSLAAAGILTIGLQTNMAGAAIDKVKSLFVEEKTVTETMEGTKEKTDYKRKIGEKTHYDQARFVLYVDDERYKTKQTADAFIVSPNVSLDETYPEVSMTITQSSSVPSDTLAELKKKLSTYKTVQIIGEVNEPLKATAIQGIGGSGGTKWNDPIIRYYVFPNEQGGSFVITEKYFVEASEGHGTRFNQMLKQFHILNQ